MARKSMRSQPSGARRAFRLWCFEADTRETVHERLLPTRLLQMAMTAMRSNLSAILCLSVLALTGCRFSMRAGSGEFAVDARAGSDTSGERNVASSNGHDASRVAKAGVSAAARPSVALTAPDRIRQAGWHATTDVQPVAPVAIARSAVTRVIQTGGGTLAPVPAFADEPRKIDAAESSPVPAASTTAEPQAASPMPQADTSLYPLNLTTALQLGGGNNLQIALASERIHEAVAKLDAAEVLWLPSLKAGVGFNSHTGKIQATNGEIVEVDRQSVFVGGGPVLGDGPLAGGSGGPIRLVANLSPVDAWFERLAAQQSASAAEADQTVVYNDTLFKVTVAWLQLQESQSQVAIANEAIGHARKLASQTRQFADAGAGLEADALRAQAGLLEYKRRKLEADEMRDVASATLAGLLRLPIETPLFASDAQPVPLEIISANLLLSELLSQGMNYRPELLRQQALLDAAYQRTRQEQLRPWLPNLQAGLSAGGFAGGTESNFGSLQDRVDIDALAVWEVRNLGFGNAALRDRRDSQHRQACLTLDSFRDQVATEIAQAHARVQHRRAQIYAAAAQLKAAGDALPLNLRGIEGGELRPIEAQQAIQGLATARRHYLRAIVTYNEAQFALLRAVGEPPESVGVSENPSDAIDAE